MRASRQILRTRDIIARPPSMFLMILSVPLSSGSTLNGASTMIRSMTAQGLLRCLGGGRTAPAFVVCWLLAQGSCLVSDPAAGAHGIAPDGVGPSAALRGDDPVAAEKKAPQGSPALEEAEEKEETSGRSFLFKELVFSSLYAPDGVAGLPPGDEDRDHFELSPRPPGTYAGIDYVKTFTAASAVNRRFFPRWLRLSALDLHPRLVSERTERGDELDRIKFAPQDFWMRLNPGGPARERLTLRIGQFVLPYGANPILAPRQKFLLPIESTDIGMKWDWGLDLKGPAGKYDWELAATIGSGEAFHSPRFFGRSDRTSYLLSGRFGTPTYWDFQNGVSFLYGKMPILRGTQVISDTAIPRWRIAYDSVYKHGTYLMAGGQVSFGRDRFQREKSFESVNGGETADVLGVRGWVDWVLPRYQNFRVSSQIESVSRDLSTPGSRDSAFILELGHTLTTSLSLLFDYRLEFSRATGEDLDAVYLTFVFYGL